MFRSSATRVPKQKLPRIPYFMFLSSSVCKLCQSVTVLASITHARCFPQVDYFLDSVIKNVSAISKNKIMEKPFCFDHVKNISICSAEKLLHFHAWNLAQHRVVFSSGHYVCKQEKCPYYIRLSLKKHCLHMLGRDLFVLGFFTSKR